MKTVHETSTMSGDAHVSCIKYQNLNNIPHYHSDYELVYINKGQASVTVNENIFNLNAGKCVFIDSNDIHCIHSNETTTITVLKANRNHFENIFALKKLLHPVRDGELNIEHVLNGIGTELTVGGDNSEIMADSIAAQFFITILRSRETCRCENKKSGHPCTTEIYTEIGRIIAEEYSTITFEKATQYMHFSGPYFSKLFHSIFGMTFTRYLNTVKMAVAIEKLREGRLSITEISSLCGFNSIRNFNRVFRDFTGYSPKNLPQSYVFLYSLKDGCGLDPTLTCTKTIPFMAG